MQYVKLKLLGVERRAQVLAFYGAVFMTINLCCQRIFFISRYGFIFTWDRITVRVISAHDSSVLGILGGWWYKRRMPTL